MKKKRRSTNISGVSKEISESIAQSVEDHATKKAERPLDGKRVAISVSTSDDLGRLGLSEQHVKDVTVEIARYLLVNGATLLYGGDLRIGGYTEIFAQLTEQYTSAADADPHFFNYFPFPNARNLTTSAKARFVKQRVGVNVLEAPSHLSMPDADAPYPTRGPVEDRYLFAECFADMRKVMSEDCDARIVVGGKRSGYLGYFAGIVEESFYTLEARKPLYVAGGFGGAASDIAKVIEGASSGLAAGNMSPEQIALIEHASGKSAYIVDPRELDRAFEQYRLKRFAKTAGLSTVEAELLLRSQNIHEIVFLILKGLRKAFSKSNQQI